MRKSGKTAKRKPGKLKNGLDPDIGLATRFKPGESPNPGGRPRSKPITDAYLALLEQKFPNDPKGRTYAELLAEGQLRAAIKGSTPAARETTDRVEGPVSQQIELGGKDGGPMEFNLNIRFRSPDDEKQK